MSTPITNTGSLNKDIELIIFIPKGTKGAYIQKFSKFKRQKEFLIDKSTTLKVIGTKNNKFFMEVKI